MKLVQKGWLYKRPNPGYADEWFTILGPATDAAKEGRLRRFDNPAEAIEHLEASIGKPIQLTQTLNLELGLRVMVEEGED
jgi:hypothetical protein